MATISQKLSFLLDAASSYGFSFNQFDPSLGTLTSIRLGISATSATTLSAENQELHAFALGADVTSSIWLDLRSNAFGTVLASVKGTGTADLGAFDGAHDFAGSSGVSGLLLAGSGSGVSDLAYQAGFIGTATLSLEAWDSTLLHVSGGAGLRLMSDAANTVEATLTYDYTPPPVGTTGGTSGSVITTYFPPTIFTPTIPIVVPPASSITPTVTSGPQTVSFAAKTTGWTDTAAIARFDPAEGTLRAVNLRLSTTLAALAKIENQSTIGSGYTVVNQFLTAIVTAPGPTGPLAATTVGTSRPYTYLSNFDGSSDFTGTSGITQAASPLTGAVAVEKTDSTTLAAFTGSGTLDLEVLAAGSSTIDGLPEILADLSATGAATLQVSYTYEPIAPVTPIAVATPGGSTTPTPAAYTGPVAGILNEFAQITPDSIAVSAAIDSWYIRTGDGNDAIKVSGGTNVLDGGRGSNFLTGGVGKDTFFVDAQWVSAPIWSTVVDLMPGDAVTVWGLTGAEQVNYWRDNEGAAGNTGLTLHARMPFLPFVSVTLAGYSKADLDSGRLEASYGTSGDVPYFHIRAV